MFGSAHSFGYQFTPSRRVSDNYVSSSTLIARSDTPHLFFEPREIRRVSDFERR